MTYDVIVIGGGSAGLMAGIAASKDGAKVLLIDKGDNWGVNSAFLAAADAM
ncbi:tricarballylate dehydrogenase [compost metagenome]